MQPALAIGIVLASFLVMEGVAWATHKYVMHGFLWILHKDHHRKDHYHALERNDLFFLIFALPSVLLSYFGVRAGFSQPWFWMGVGIFIYGLAYFLVHEVFIHQRIKWLRDTENVYFLALRRAHKKHHKHLEKEHGECFGMLFVPLRYFTEARRVLRERGHHRGATPGSHA